MNSLYAFYIFIFSLIVVGCLVLFLKWRVVSRKGHRGSERVLKTLNPFDSAEFYKAEKEDMWVIWLIIAFGLLWVASLFLMKRTG